MTSIWAHRGASAVAPENTLAAFERAIELGADGIELDVQRCADGELVVCHDETVDRTTNGHGAIVDLTFDELRVLDASHGMPGFEGVRIPTLLEVLELVADTELMVNIELKDSEQRYWGMDVQARSLVERLGVADRITWSSFNHWSLRALRASDGQARIGVLFAEQLLDPWVYVEQIHAQAIHPSWQALAMMPETIERCHDAHVAVNVWTVDDPDKVRELADAGVDAIITNRPDVARQALPD